METLSSLRSKDGRRKEATRMSWLKKLRYKRAQKAIRKAIRFIDKLSWEEIDSMFPPPRYNFCFGENWKDVELVDLSNGERKEQE